MSWLSGRFTLLFVSLSFSFHVIFISLFVWGMARCAFLVTSLFISNETNMTKHVCWHTYEKSFIFVLVVFHRVFFSFALIIQQFSERAFIRCTQLFKATALQFFFSFLFLFFLQLFSSGRHSFDKCNAKEWQTRRVFFSRRGEKLQRWEETHIWLSRIQWLR